MIEAFQQRFSESRKLETQLVIIKAQLLYGRYTRDRPVFQNLLNRGLDDDPLIKEVLFIGKTSKVQGGSGLKYSILPDRESNIGKMPWR